MNKLKLSISVLVSLLCCASLSAAESDVIASVEYFYAQDGTLIGRAINGVRQNFEYDRRGQLLAVKDAAGRDLERYTYDPVGNRLSKTVNGITTTYTYDEANQLKTSTVNGETTHYRYDAAGRLVQAGDKTYYYFGANDKVTEVRHGDKVIAEFDYFMDGQIASAKYPDREENFTWDGLALVQRNEVSYLNEPYVTGGNPILSSQDGVMFNDMLGSTLNIGRQIVSMTSFGETEDDAAFFTGKPLIPELGYSFLVRDYNPAQGKWTSSDPLGYPDGWNNLAYCNNDSINNFDFIGGLTTQEKQIYIVNQLNAVAKMNLGHSLKVQALLNATLSNNTNPLAIYLTNASDSVSNLNSALPKGAPGKNAIDALAKYLSASQNVSQALEYANNRDPRFMSCLLELSGAKNLPGIGSYIDFIDNAIIAISSGLNPIKLNLAMNAVKILSDPVQGDLMLERIVKCEWLVPEDRYNQYLKRLQE